MMRHRRYTATAEVEAMTLTGMLIKADTSTHTKWQKRWFVLRGRWLSYYRNMKSTSVSGRVVLDSDSTIEISNLRPNAFKLSTAKRTLHAQASNAEDLAKWMSSIGNAIKIEQELASGTLVDSEDDMDYVENTKRPTTRKLASNYSDIVRASLSRKDSSAFRAAISRQISSSHNNNDDEKNDKVTTKTPKRERPLWQPMVGLFSQLIDHFTSPSPHKHVTTTNVTSNEAEETQNVKSSSWHIGVSLEVTVSVEKTLPPVVDACRTYLRAKNRLETDGIFRVPGRAHVVSSIRDALSKNEICPGDEDAFSKLVSEKNVNAGGEDGHATSNVYNVATLMKSCLAELPEPVVPLKCYLRLLEIHGECTTREARLEAAKVVLRDRELISKSHVQCLFLILEFLQDVSRKSHVNRMASSQLAICFAPTLFRPPQNSTNPVKIMRDMCAGIGVVEILIENARDPMLRLESCDDLDRKRSISKLVMSRAKGRRGRRRPSVVRSCRVRSMTVGQVEPTRKMIAANRMMRARRNALLAVGSDEEETRRRRRESSSDRKFFVTHAFIRSTSTRSPDSLKGNERRRVLLDTHARTLRIVSLEGSLCVKNLVDVHRHENTSEIHGTGSNSMNWHTLTLVLSPDRRKQEDTRLLHFSTPPADAGRWATSLSAIARHGQYLSTTCSSNSKLPKKALESIDTNVLDRDQIKFSNETTKEGTNTAVDDETMIMHGFMYLLSSQEEWRRVHVTLTDTMLEWVLCAKHDDVSSSSTGIALYLENVRVGPTFLGTTGSCFTLSAANPSMVMTATNPLPLVVRMSRSKGTLWNTLLRSCSATSDISQNIKAASAIAARRRQRRRRRRSSVVNHAVAAQFQNGTFRNNNKLRRFPSDRRSLHMSVKYNVEWECDGNDVRCACCSIRFTMFRRRHHCRLCGNLVCDACSQSRLPTQFSGTLERACDECVSQKTKYLNENDDAKKSGEATRERKNTTDFLQLIKHYEAQTQQHRRALSSMAVHFSEIDRSFT